MKVSLTIEIEYDVSAYADKADALTEIQEILHRSCARMIGNGGLTEDTSLEADSYEIHTDTVEE